MKASLKLEIIGENMIAEEKKMRGICETIAQGSADVVIGRKKLTPHPWVAEITGKCPRFGLARKFLKFSKDYAEANGKGSRGILACFVLESGKSYEVFERVSWAKSRRYFCFVDDKGDIVEIERGDLWQKSL
jgi:hypothetical protein